MTYWARFVLTYLVALASMVLFLPGVVAAYRTTEHRDFEQEWLSARNFRTGFPIYARHQASVVRYPDGPVGPVRFWATEINAHPPSSVLLVGLPLAALSYPSAFLAWNLFSLAAFLVSVLMVARNLVVQWDVPKVLLFIALALSCGPLNSQLYQGQLNLVLLALIVGVWVADRQGRPAAAGALLGAAAVLKIYPAFLFFFFLLRRRWRVVAIGAATAAALTALTAAILGTASYRDYLFVVMPTLSDWRSSWGNLSVFALWSKLFDPQMRVAGMDSTQPILHSPLIARLGTVLSAAALVILLSRVVLRSRGRDDEDRAFSLTLIVMLLVTPDLWSHYLVLLMLPIMLLWSRLPTRSVAKADLLVIVVLLWLNPEVWWHMFIDRMPEHGQTVTTPLQTLTALSIPTYALLGLFGLGMATRPRGLTGRPST